MNFLMLGINLRTGQSGIFPLAHVFEVDFEDVAPGSSLGSKFANKVIAI